MTVSKMTVYNVYSTSGFQVELGNHPNLIQDSLRWKATLIKLDKKLINVDKNKISAPLI